MVCVLPINVDFYYVDTMVQDGVSYVQRHWEWYN